MKLLLCPSCGDVFKLAYRIRHCLCGMTSGHYLPDGLNARYTAGIPLGFKNSDLQRAIGRQPESGMGEEFIAFVIPKSCPTFVQGD